MWKPRLTSSVTEALGKVSEVKDYWTPLELASEINRSDVYVLNAINRKGRKPPPTLNAIKVEEQWLIPNAEAERYIKLHFLPSSQTALQCWFEGNYQEEWKPVSAVVKWRVSFRNAPVSEQTISRAKKFQLGKRFFGLVLFLVPEGSTYSILVRICPVGRTIILPKGLTLTVRLLESGDERQLEANLEQRFIQVEVEDVRPSERFDAIIAFEGITFTETFTL